MYFSGFPRRHSVFADHVRQEAGSICFLSWMKGYGYYCRAPEAGDSIQPRSPSLAEQARAGRGEPKVYSSNFACVKAYHTRIILVNTADVLSSTLRYAPQ